MKNSKYNKKLKYRKHPRLEESINLSHFLKIFIAILLITLLVGFFDEISYSNISKSIGFTSMIMVLLYQVLVRPLVYKGKIKAYYRRDNTVISNYNKLYFWIASIYISRFLVISSLHFRMDRDIMFLFDKSFHPIGTSLSILIPMLMFYLTFYSDKYITIEDFSNRINYRMRFNNEGLYSALLSLKKEQDKFHNIKEFDGTFYDYEATQTKLEKENQKKNMQTHKKENKAKNNNIRREMRDKNVRNKMDGKTQKRL